MDSSRFDTLVRDVTTRPGTQRRMFVRLIAGLLIGLVAAPLAQVETVEGRCRQGQKSCHNKCCPRRGPVCCKNYCCKKGSRCCGNKQCCQK